MMKLDNKMLQRSLRLIVILIIGMLIFYFKLDQDWYILIRFAAKLELLDWIGHRILWKWQKLLMYANT